MGWNNVLIFASMFMILLFNYSHRMMTQGHESGETNTLVGVNTIIQSIDFNGIKIERLGANWRSISGLELNKPLNTELIIETWTQQPFVALQSPPLLLDTTKIFLVVVWAAGEPSGWVYEFAVDNVEQTAYVKDHQQNIWFYIEPASLAHLIPEPILEL